MFMLIFHFFARNKKDGRWKIVAGAMKRLFDGIHA